jgi:transposase
VSQEVTVQELIQQKEVQIQQLRQENKLLKEKVDLLIRRLFGVKSEQLDAAQLELLLKEADLGKADASAEKAEAAPITGLLKPVPKRKGKKERRERWPQDLPVESEIIEPAQVIAQPEAFRCIGEEISETLDYRPAKFFRHQIIRRKFVSRQEPQLPPVIGSLPESLQERCIAAPGLLAQITISKYCDHLPLYRQEQIYWSRHQVWLPRQSMARWMELVSEWLKPIYAEMKAQMMSGPYIQVDETPIRYLDPGNGKTGQGYLWVAHRPGGDVIYEWHTTRAASCLERLIPIDFTGTVQCDGYSAYDRFASRREGQGQALILAGCWAHVRRGFFEARDSAPREAAWVLVQLKHLYHIEAELRCQRAGVALRDAYRSSQSRPVTRRIRQALERWHTNRRFLPQSSMGKAISYALGQWESLEVYLQDAQIEIDNNLVENAIRPTALGKKNWLFFGDAHAGERSAVIYSIIESCRRNGVEPYTYLCDVLSRLPSMTNWQIKEITPKVWAQSRKSSTQKAA